MSLKEDMRKYRIERIEHYLSAADGNVTRAAQLAEVDRTEFHRQMRQYGLRSTFMPHGGNAAWQQLSS